MPLIAEVRTNLYHCFGEGCVSENGPCDLERKKMFWVYLFACMCVYL